MKLRKIKEVAMTDFPPEIGAATPVTLERLAEDFPGSMAPRAGVVQ
jgi:hypothetical protein